MRNVSKVTSQSLAESSLEYAQEAECRSLIAAIEADAADPCGPELAAEVVGVVLGLFPARELSDPATFLEYARLSLCGLPADVVVKLAHPSYGIHRETKFLPTIAELVQWCEREMKARKIALAQARSRLAVLERRKLRGPIFDTPPQRASWEKLSHKPADFLPKPAGDTARTMPRHKDALEGVDDVPF